MKIEANSGGWGLFILGIPFILLGILSAIVCKGFLIGWNHLNVTFTPDPDKGGTND